jgi:hypothetical protein
MMGLLASIGGAIGSAIAGVGAAVGNALSTAGTWLSGVASTLGPTVTKFADSFLAVVAKIPKIDDVDPFLKIVDLVGKIIQSIGEIFEVHSEDNAEVLGAKAQQAEKTMADFDNDTAAYINYLNKEIELDKEKFDKMSDAEKLGCKAAGIALETKAIEEKIGGISISPEYVAAMARIEAYSELVLNAREWADIIIELKNAGITNLKDVVDYLEAKGDSDTIKTGQVLRAALATVEPEKDTNDIIEEMKQVFRGTEEQS